MRMQTEELYERPQAEVISLTVESAILEGSNEPVVPGEDF